MDENQKHFKTRGVFQRQRLSMYTLNELHIDEKYCCEYNSAFRV